MLLEEACAKKDFGTMIQVCVNAPFIHFGFFMTTMLLRNRRGKPSINDDLEKAHASFQQAIQSSVRIQLLCNWTTSEELTRYWTKMLPPTSKISFVTSQPDCWVILNAPPSNAVFDPKKSIVFQMEPHMDKNTHWGKWGSPDPTQFLQVFTHKKGVNPLEWHLGKTYKQLMEQPIQKTEDFSLSTILSSKYNDEGHRKRVDFIKYIENKLPVHVYGEDAFHYRNYKGSLPYHEKENGLFPYKYTFNAENHSIPNYCTEKIIDAILSECVCFYWGCPNLETILHPECFIRLSLTNVDEDANRILKAIEQDEWSQRIDIIRQEKRRILTDLQFTVQLEKLFKVV